MGRGPAHFPRPQARPCRGSRASPNSWHVAARPPARRRTARGSRPWRWCLTSLPPRPAPAVCGAGAGAIRRYTGGGVTCTPPQRPPRTRTQAELRLLGAASRARRGRPAPDASWPPPLYYLPLPPPLYYLPLPLLRPVSAPRAMRGSLPSQEGCIGGGTKMDRMYAVVVAHVDPARCLISLPESVGLEMVKGSATSAVWGW